MQATKMKYHYKPILLLEIIGSEEIHCHKNGYNVWCFDDYDIDYNRTCWL